MGIVTIIIFILTTSSFVSAQSPNIKKDLLSIIGAENSFVFDHYKENKSNDAFIKKVILTEQKHRPTFREEEKSYRKLRRSYLAHSLYQHFKSNENSRSIASTKKNRSLKLKYKLPQFLGLIFFKKNEVSKVCKKVVDKAVGMGAKGIAFFYPVHYSGGNSDTEFMPKNPVYGRDYKYEYAQAPIEKNVFKCLDYIVEKKLEINWVPHLESIVSLESSGRSEWRMYSGIPLDHHYYINSFGPLLSYIKNSDNKKKFLSSLSITFAAEIDNMAIGRPEDSIRIIDNLNRQMKRYTFREIPMLLNTNGDFFHLWKIPQVNKATINCNVISKLFSKIDILSPSMYGDKGHFKQAVKSKQLSVENTLKTYKSRLSNSVPKRCKTARSKITSIEVGFGEFALDLSKDQKYQDILINSGKIKYVQYWNHSAWDHLGVVTDSKESVKAQLLIAP